MRVAIWQCPQHSCTTMADTAVNWSRLETQARQAAQAGVELLVLPELFVTGYLRPGAILRTLALDATAMARQLGAVAARQGVSLVCGYAERLGPDAIANSACWVDEQGRCLLNTRKTHLFGDAERRVFIAGDPREERRVATWRGWCCGLLICYDVEFAENVRRLAQAGADAVLVPTANMEGYDPVPQWVVPTRAYESQVYLAYANACGQEHCGRTTLTYGGLSVLATPDGIDSRIAGREEALCTTDWSREQLMASRQRHPFAALWPALS